MIKIDNVKNWTEMIGNVVCGDCMEAMKLIPDKSIDLVLTDPPYGIGLANGFSGAGGFSKPIQRRKYKGDWDNNIPTKEYFNEIFRISKVQIIFGGNYFSNILPQNNHWIVWDKLNTMPTFSDCELIYTSIKRNSVMKFTYNNNGLMAKEKNRVHPTQKPLELFRWILVNYSNETDLIFDGFLGSGTTARACKDLGRRWIGIEKEEQYCSIADERLRQYNLF
jgi:site-specific DNA-methyltransferase (adenine-specific)